MNVSQQFNHINENNYDDDISITDIPQGHFLAVTANKLADGSNTREIHVMIMQLEQSPGGTMQCNPGLYIKGADETAVKVTVTQDGQEVATNTTNY